MNSSKFTVSILYFCDSTLSCVPSFSHTTAGGGIPVAVQGSMNSSGAVTLKVVAISGSSISGGSVEFTLIAIRYVMVINVTSLDQKCCISRYHIPKAKVSFADVTS